MFRLTTVVLLVLFMLPIAYSQQTLNLDFEELSVEGVHRPWGWSVYSYAPNVRFICDTTEQHSGQYGLKIQNPQKHDSSPFELSFFIEPSQILESELVVTGWVKSEGFQGKSGIRLESIGDIGEEFGTLSKSEVNIEPAKEWEQYTTEISLPARHIPF